jgi:hypothetical protein
MGLECLLSNMIGSTCILMMKIWIFIGKFKMKIIRRIVMINYKTKSLKNSKPLSSLVKLSRASI